MAHSSVAKHTKGITRVDQQDIETGMTDSVNRVSNENERVLSITSDLFSYGDDASYDIPGLHLSLAAGADARDDCAVFDLKGDATLVFGSDYVRGPKFDLYGQGLLDNYDIGYYLASANISDIAAMGAVPVGLLSVVRYPHDLEDEQFNQILEGIRDSCSISGVMNVGGDIGSAERIILSASAFGICERGKALLRSGANPGDVLCVTGDVGRAGAAMMYAKNPDSVTEVSPATLARLLEAWRRPKARVREGRALATSGHATACQDVSDGLKATILQLSSASGVGFEIEEALLPIDPSVASVAEACGLDVTGLAMSASVDFQLLFTVSEGGLDAVCASFDREGVELFEIGRATSSNACTMLRRDGTRADLPGVEWKHQAGNLTSSIADQVKRRS